MYTADLGESQGYVNGDQAFWDNWIDEMVDLTEDNGMYCMIDWHILKDNNPFQNISTARTFFSKMSKKYANRRHVIYEICNEPNGGVSWGTIKDYAEEIIPIIRANDPDAIILVGTPEWCSRPQDAANDPLTGANAHNVMYTVHFYANTHYWQNTVSDVSDDIPIFVSEWGSVDASGNGGFNQGNSDNWLNLLAGNNNGGQLISHCNWSFVDKDEAASALTPGACAANDWDSRSTAGNYIYNKIRTGDNFSSCSAAGDDDNDGITNGEDNCPNTPPNSYVDASGCVDENDSDGDGVVDQDDLCPNTSAGTIVNAVGCEIANDFISNVCIGFNNVQNYIYSDFEFEYANVHHWNPEVGESDVYYAYIENGELVIEATAADPDYAAQGFSFGEENNGDLVEFDMSAHKIIEMDLKFEPTGAYGSDEVLYRIQIEDADGNVINSDALENDHRQIVPINADWTHVSFDFTDGVNVFWDEDQGGDCGPCVYTEFDFTRVTKVIMFCNPGAGASWSEPEFTGIWRIDNLMVGYDEDAVETCETIRDDDNDGVREENDTCRFTIEGSSVNAQGCAVYQLDADNDGVSDADDACPNSPEGAVVNAQGCDATEADDDNDGVPNVDDVCPLTPLEETVDAEGCSASQKDEDGDGVPNASDQCANTPSGEDVDNKGCSDAQLNADDDDDGVVNADDICPGTPADEPVDADGCELDDDNDGTPNGSDECPNDPNKIVEGDCGCGVEEGCVIDCHGDVNGNAYEDNCGICVGGNTGLDACVGNPYNGTPQVIPGVVQAEFYDEGGQDVGYYEVDGANSHPNPGFRTSEFVEVELAESSTSNYNVGYTAVGDWMNYTVDVQNTGLYTVEFRVASENATGAWHLELDGEEITGTDLALNPGSGGWQTYTIVSSSQIELTKGAHVLTFVVDGVDVNLDQMDFKLDQITSVHDKLENELYIYPNPVDEKLRIEGDVNGTWELYNAQGMQLTTGENNEINMNRYDAGVYFIKVNAQVIKFLKN